MVLLAQPLIGLFFNERQFDWLTVASGQHQFENPFKYNIEFKWLRILHLSLSGRPRDESIMFSNTVSHPI